MSNTPARIKSNDLHFYARAMSTNGKIYVVTATAKESQWPTVSDTLKKHVESFQTTSATTAPSSPANAGDERLTTLSAITAMTALAIDLSAKVPRETMPGTGILWEYTARPHP